ncbi:uncharacterized protein EI90DRAFT_3046701 [Cantharellus anzutake]|uniref:uncharacterized protein n=1 Tax=Cantharellus anzutake TaxID=1750568 RepID=UPI001906FFF2|nr:uncharacterized protein EI90DRAFT_3046701 [Cantharellus anzutake]KAF8336660.1 hypothetical protein EI90DRAFT_3046701 [Cantharellus anzutake]
MAVTTLTMASPIYFPKRSNSPLFPLKMRSAALVAACRGGNTPDAVLTAVRTGMATSPPTARRLSTLCLSDMANNEGWGEKVGRAADGDTQVEAAEFTAMRLPQGAIHPIARLWKVLRQIPSSYAEPTQKSIHTHLSWFCSRPVPGAYSLLHVRQNVW